MRLFAGCCPQPTGLRLHARPLGSAIPYRLSQRLVLLAPSLCRGSSSVLRMLHIPAGFLGVFPSGISGVISLDESLLPSPRRISTVPFLRVYCTRPRLFAFAGPLASRLVGNAPLYPSCCLSQVPLCLPLPGSLALADGGGQTSDRLLLVGGQPLTIAGNSRPAPLRRWHRVKARSSQPPVGTAGCCVSSDILTPALITPGFPYGADTAENNLGRRRHFARPDGVTKSCKVGLQFAS